MRVSFLSEHRRSVAHRRCSDALRPHIYDPEYQDHHFGAYSALGREEPRCDPWCRSCGRRQELQSCYRGRIQTAISSRFLLFDDFFWIMTKFTYVLEKSALKLVDFCGIMNAEKGRSLHYGKRSIPYKPRDVHSRSGV